MGKIQKSKDLDNLFRGIVINALGFLRHSADEFDDMPKRSLIDFITALELFIKARLLKEHWTLILNNLNKGSYANFINGDLPTIDFRDAIDRLDNVLQEPLTKQERECFEKLRLHRNKLMHFYNKAYSGKSQKAKLNSLTEISEGWFYLHRLLKDKWGNDFRKYQKKIDRITKRINENKKSWQGKYNSLKNEIEEDIKKGIIFKDCFVCNYYSTKLEEYNDPIYTGLCFICGQKRNWLKCECPECKNEIFVSDSYSTCECGEKEISFDVLKEQLEESRSPKEQAMEDYDIKCTECCSGESTVIELKNGLYFCLECFVDFDETSECEWCNTRYAGRIREDSYWLGCELCEGHAGWHKDD